MRNSRLMAQLFNELGEFERYIPIRDGFARVSDGGDLELVSGSARGLPRFQRKATLVKRDGIATLTKSDAMAAAGRYGASRTRGNEFRQRDRIRRGIDPHDFIDLATEKLEVWPEVGDTRAVRVGPKATRV